MKRFNKGMVRREALVASSSAVEVVVVVVTCDDVLVPLELTILEK